MSSFKIDWGKLAQISELKDFFQEDFSSFQQLIENNIQKFESFSPEELDKLAKLRVLEVTNGCVQWGFRLNKPESLSVDQTRKCMKTVMGFIKEKRIEFPSQGTITFEGELNTLTTEVRQLYLDAFKNNVPGADREFYASSAAQFIVYGRKRLEAAMDLVRQDYESLFSPYYIQRGRNYMAPYLDCIVTDKS